MTSLTVPRLRFSPWIVFVLVAGLTMLVLRRIAHADTGPAPAPEFSWEIYLGVALAAAGGTLKIIDVLLAGLRWLAPRTETTFDDSARDGLQIVHDKLDEVIRVVSRTQPQPPVNAAVRSGTIGLLAVLVLGFGAAAATPGCSPAQRQVVRDHTAAGAGAFLGCEAPNVDAVMLEDAKVLAISAVEAAISGDGHADADKLKADARPLRTDLLKCAFEAAIAAIATPAPKQPGVAMAAGIEVDSAALRATWAQVRGELGWAPVRLAEAAAP